MKTIVNVRQDGAIRASFIDSKRAIYRAIWFDGSHRYRAIWCDKDSWGESELNFQAPNSRLAKVLSKHTAPLGKTDTSHPARLKTTWSEASGTGTRGTGHSSATGARETSRRSNYQLADGSTRESTIDKGKSVVVQTHSDGTTTTFRVNWPADAR